MGPPRPITGVDCICLQFVVTITFISFNEFEQTSFRWDMEQKICRFIGFVFQEQQGYRNRSITMKTTRFCCLGVQSYAGLRRFPTSGMWCSALVRTDVSEERNAIIISN
jgi:hypothetical protein